ncbi:Hsp70 family protein [Streptosporangium saharense]|uniref:Molecular chaperone DnaK (HSP70) n=1 Tax=Streptosporangium saharense TaxID=1706840 RepID=A0A7W7QMW0_9ACTN|nr:Hsp70 family protein [Streptosporangium saharense]MBB4915971.1 molecular chaperone DnaK (HSP70) [Streptosporangium saharense]
MTAYGIDLGTTYSCIARVDETGRPTVLRSLEGTDTVPSVVFFESADNVVVGAAAKDGSVLEPGLAVSLIKREMAHGTLYRRHGRTYTPEEISAFILRKLAEDARVATGETVRDVVITVPACFGAAERDATRKAGEIAGLTVVDVVSEPVAAAITYGLLTPGQDRTVLVYDLGGGTFDTTVITLRGGNIEVVCTDGHDELGGADWDERLMEHLVEEFTLEHPDVDSPLEDQQAEQQLRVDAEALKRTLSSRNRHVVRVAHEGRVARVEFTRETLEELTKDLLDRTVEITRRTMRTAAAKGVRDYDQFVLVGGSTKMPAVAEALRRAFGVPVLIQDPDLAVAKGAALYAFEETYRRLLRSGDHAGAEAVAERAGLTTAQRERMADRTIGTVASRAFGIVISGEPGEARSVLHLVHANDPLPASVTEEFYTVVPDQTVVDVEIVEQAGSAESSRLDDNTRIAGGQLPIPRGKPKGWPIEVTFDLDSSGLLHVTARERETGEHLDLRVQIGGMSEEEVRASRTELSRVRIG